MSLQPIWDSVTEGLLWPKAQFSTKRQDEAQLMADKGSVEHISALFQECLSQFEVTYFFQYSLSVSGVILTPCEVCLAGKLENVSFKIP